MSVAERVTHRWSIDEFMAAADAGVFGPEARLELIEGEIYDMSPQKRPHIVATGLTRDLLAAVFGQGWTVLSQMTVPMGSHSLPEPDICIVRGSWRDLAAGSAPTVALVVEVSDTTLQFDRGKKTELYARAGIPDYWILNLVDRLLEVHRDPDPATGAYRTITRHGESDSPLAAPDALIAVRDLLP